MEPPAGPGGAVRGAADLGETAVPGVIADGSEGEDVCLRGANSEGVRGRRDEQALELELGGWDCILG